MPIPRSRTSIFDHPSFTVRTTSSGTPGREYLSALPRRLSTTSSIDVASASTTDDENDRVTLIGRPGWRRPNVSTARSTRWSRTCGSVSSVAPDPSRVSWSRFSTIRRRRSESSRMSPTLSRSAAPRLPRPRRTTALPKIVVTGVRSSCETSPRNSSLTAFETSSADAVLRSASSAASRSVTSTRTLTAPTSVPSRSRSGVGYGSKATLGPSGTGCRPGRRPGSGPSRPAADRARRTGERGRTRDHPVQASRSERRQRDWARSSGEPWHRPHSIRARVTDPSHGRRAASTATASRRSLEGGDERIEELDPPAQPARLGIHRLARGLAAVAERQPAGPPLELAQLGRPGGEERAPKDRHVIGRDDRELELQEQAIVVRFHARFTPLTTTWV